MVLSYECNTLFRCAACLCTRVSEGAHLLFLFPRESLERARLKFSLQGGKVTALCLQEGEQVWALNMKRALLSMFQTSRMASKQELVQEVRLDQGCVPSLQNTSLLFFLIKRETPPLPTVINIIVLLSHSVINSLCTCLSLRQTFTGRAPAGTRDEDKSF